MTALETIVGAILLHSATQHRFAQKNSGCGTAIEVFSFQKDLCLKDQRLEALVTQEDFESTPKRKCFSHHFSRS